MTKCVKCGAPLREGEVFCHECGEKCPAADAAVRPVKRVKPRRTANVCAIVGLSLAFFIPVAGLVLSLIARENVRSGRFDKPYKSLADWGLAVSIIMLILSLLTLLFLVLFHSVVLVELIEALTKLISSLPLQ